MNINQIPFGPSAARCETNRRSSQEPLNLSPLAQEIQQVSNCPPATAKKPQTHQPSSASSTTLADKVTKVHVKGAANDVAREAACAARKEASDAQETVSDLEKKPARARKRNKKVALKNVPVRTDESPSAMQPGTSANTHSISEADISKLQEIDRLRLMRTNLNDNRRSNIKSVTQFQKRKLEEVNAKEGWVVNTLNALYEKHGDEIFKVLKHVQSPLDELKAQKRQSEQFTKYRETAMSIMSYKQSHKLRPQAREFLQLHTNPDGPPNPTRDDKKFKEFYKHMQQFLPSHAATKLSNKPKAHSSGQ